MTERRPIDATVGEACPMPAGGPPVVLRPLEPAELSSVLEQAIRGYGEDRAEAVGATLADATRHARAQTSAALPGGLATPAHHLYAVMEGEDAVGHVWMAITEVDGFPCAFLYDLWLCERARGRGIGRAVMALAEAEARGLGARDLELHVFAHNARAQALYASLGYQVTSVVMRRTLR